MNDDIYCKFQPVTWGIGIVDAMPNQVADAIATNDPRASGEAPTYREYGSIEYALRTMEPLHSPGRYLVVPTVDGRAAIFTNMITFQTVTEYATWIAGEACAVRAYFVLRVPQTIAPDKRSGEWGARQIIVRDPENMKTVQEPTFGIGVINDAGRWVLERFGRPQSFEETEAYHARRVKDRFTDDMLLRYCAALGIPVYDSQWYKKDGYMVPMQFITGEGLTYGEAAERFRIPLP